MVVGAINDIINRQYPHFLYKRISDGEAVQDANGSWTTAGASWKFCGTCREETNGKGTTIQAANGRIVVFSSAIYAPVDVERIADGVEVLASERKLEPDELTNEGIEAAKASGVIRICGECLKFDKGRLHGRIWV